MDDNDMRNAINLCSMIIVNAYKDCKAHHNVDDETAIKLAGETLKVFVDGAKEMTEHGHKSPIYDLFSGSIYGGKAD